MTSRVWLSICHMLGFRFLWIHEPEYLAWPFTTSLNRNIMIWWGFFRQTAPATMPVHIGANSLKKPHHIVILRFSEVVKGHANWNIHFGFRFWLKWKSLFFCCYVQNLYFLLFDFSWVLAKTENTFFGCTLNTGTAVLCIGVRSTSNQCK